VLVVDSPERVATTGKEMATVTVLVLQATVMAVLKVKAKAKVHERTQANHHASYGLSLDHLEGQVEALRWVVEAVMSVVNLVASP